MRTRERLEKLKKKREKLEEHEFSEETNEITVEENNAFNTVQQLKFNTKK